MTGRFRACAVGILLAGLAAAGTSCAPRTPPVAPGAAAWRQPDVPADLASRAADMAAYEHAWTRIRNGDAGGGERELTALLKKSPAFYPAATSLGEFRLRRQQYREAAALFAEALAVNATYRPAMAGLADARLGARDDAGAVTALQALLDADPAQTDVRARLDVVRMRVSQAELAHAEKARAAGQLDAAEAALRRALEATPENVAVLRSLAVVYLARGALEDAEARARQAAALDPEDAAAMAVLGDVLDAQGRDREAAAAYARAVAIDPRPEWVERRESLRARAEASALPDNYRAIAGAASVTRAQVAAILGVRLAAVLDHAPARVPGIVTDVGGDWAAAWIMPVVRAGWIAARPNHTFAPGAPVRRADLARIVAAVLPDAAAGRARDLARWRAERPVFADVPRDHEVYGDAAFAVSAGIMTAEAKRFVPAGVVSGAELIATIARLEALAR